MCSIEVKTQTHINTSAKWWAKCQREWMGNFLKLCKICLSAEKFSLAVKCFRRSFRSLHIWACIFFAMRDAPWSGYFPIYRRRKPTKRNKNAKSKMNRKNCIWNIWRIVVREFHSKFLCALCSHIWRWLIFSRSLANSVVPYIARLKFHSD